MPTTGYVLAGAGYDSNPVLLDEGLQPAGGSGSPVVELLGVLTLPLAGTRRAATVLNAGVSSKEFARDVGANQRGLFVPAQRRPPAAARVARPGGAKLRLGYDREFNDREDLVAGSEFFSSSPVRHRVEAVLEHAAGDNASLRWVLRYRESRYRDPDRFMVGPTLREQRRVEELSLASLQWRGRLAPELFLLIEAQGSRNQATVQTWDYERFTALVGVEWVPAGE